MYKLSLNKRNGFSFIELMITIVIMGLMMSVVVINVLPSQDRAMTEKVKVDIAVLTQALEMYKMDNFRYPSTDQGLKSLLVLPKKNNFRSQGYIKNLPKDPWGNEYQYLFPGEKNFFDLYSLGADGKLGGQDENADIGIWVNE